MASNATIKGLTIEIGANTTKFSTALKSLESDARNISKDLKTVNENMKLDPSNVEKSADKLKLLQDAAKNASAKVDLIKQAIKKLNEQEADKSTDKYKNALADLERQLESAEREQSLANERVKAFGNEAENAGKGALTLGDIIKANLISGGISTGLKAIAGFFEGIAKSALNAAKRVAEFAKQYAMEAVDMAASYEDALGYSEQVFTEQAESVQKWVETNSSTLRIGETDLIGYVNSFGALFRTFGYSAQEAEKNSERLIQLAVDLRAATGDDMSQIIQSLTSGLTGGYKAFQRYGVVVNEARIKAQALSMGLVDVNVNQLEVEKATLKVTEANKKASEALQKHGEDSLEYQKAQIAIQEAEENLTKALGGKEVALDDVTKKTVILAILNNDLAFAEGQAAKESGSYSSQLALRDTLLQNLQRRIGSKLLPVFTEFVTKVNELMESDAGKAVMDALAESVGVLAGKVMELLQDERLIEWLQGLKDELPKVAEKVVGFAGDLGELIPKVLDLTEKVVDFFERSSKTKDAKEAYAEVQKELHAFAEQAGIDYNDLIKGIKGYAEATDTDLADVYRSWEIYKPEVLQYMMDLATGAEEAQGDVGESVKQMSTDVSNGFTAVGNTDTSGLDRLRERVRGWADNIVSFGKQVWDTLSRAEEENSFIDSNGNERRYGGGVIRRASGGNGYANKVYLVGDDAQNRPEIYIPNTDGRFLNGDQTERILNNISNNNSSNFNGGINVYVNSYGMDLATVSEELGYAIQQKLRMSGARL